MVGIINKKDGTVFTQEIGSRKPAIDFKNAMKGKNWSEAATSLKSLLDLASLDEGLYLISNKKKGVALENSPIVKLLSDPDWNEKDLASLLIKECGIKDGMDSTTVVGNTLFAMRKNNSDLADNVLTEIKKIDPKLHGELTTIMDNLQSLEDGLNQLAKGQLY